MGVHGMHADASKLNISLSVSQSLRLSLKPTPSLTPSSSPTITLSLHIKKNYLTLSLPPPVPGHPYLGLLQRPHAPAAPPDDLVHGLGGGDMHGGAGTKLWSYVR